MLRIVNSHKQTEELHRRALYAQATLESVLHDARLKSETFSDISVALQRAWRDTEHQDLDEINEMKLLERLMDQDTPTESFQTIITQVTVTLVCTHLKRCALSRGSVSWKVWSTPSINSLRVCMI